MPGSGYIWLNNSYWSLWIQSKQPPKWLWKSWHWPALPRTGTMLWGQAAEERQQRGRCQNLHELWHDAFCTRSLGTYSLNTTANTFVSVTEFGECLSFRIWPEFSTPPGPYWKSVRRFSLKCSTHSLFWLKWRKTVFRVRWSKEHSERGNKEGLTSLLFFPTLHWGRNCTYWTFPELCLVCWQNQTIRAVSPFILGYSWMVQGIGHLITNSVLYRFLYQTRHHSIWASSIKAICKVIMHLSCGVFPLILSPEWEAHAV